MKTFGFFLAASMLTLSACSSGEDGGDGQDAAEGSSESAPAEDDSAASAYSNAFYDRYRSEFISSCVAAATSRGAQQADAEQGCSCAVDVLIRDLSLAELTNPTEDQLTAAMGECIVNVEQPDG